MDWLTSEQSCARNQSKRNISCFWQNFPRTRENSAAVGGVGVG